MQICGVLVPVENWMHSFEVIVAFLMDVVNVNDVIC